MRATERKCNAPLIHHHWDNLLTGVQFPSPSKPKLLHPPMPPKAQTREKESKNSARCQVVDCVNCGRGDEELTHHAAETQSLEEAAQVVFLNLDDAVVEAVNADAGVGLLDHLLEGDSESIAQQVFLSSRVFVFRF